MIEKGTIFYWGTNGSSAGHFLKVYGKDKLTYDERRRIEYALESVDSNHEIVNDVFKGKLSTFGSFYFNDMGTVFGMLSSPDDERYGCKTLFLVWGERKTETEMIDIAKSNDFFRKQFTRLAQRWKVDIPWLEKTTDYTIDDCISEFEKAYLENKYKESGAKLKLVASWLKIAKEHLKQ